MNGEQVCASSSAGSSRDIDGVPAPFRRDRCTAGMRGPAPFTASIAGFQGQARKSALTRA